MQSKAKTVADYLEELPEDRRAVVSKVRALVRKHLPKGMTEAMGYGMIVYSVPHKVYPPGYHVNPEMPLMYAALAAQKNAYSLYLMTVAIRPDLAAKLREEFDKAGKKLDMGKSCIRFKKLEDLPAGPVGEAIGVFSMADYITAYEDMLKLAKARPKGRPAARKKTSRAR